jgi:hypothetical protein
MLLKATALLLLVHYATAIDCQTAWSSLYDDDNGACSTSELTSDDLNADVCPEACQTLLDNVIANCSDGDQYVEGLGYKAALLYHEYFQTTFSPKWKSCNYGYTPTSCDIAYGTLSVVRFGDAYKYGPQITDTLISCEKTANEVCSEDCKALINNVAQSCPIGAAFSPSCCYLGLTSAQTSWESDSMELMGYNPNKFDILGTLSMDCWDYYESSSGVVDEEQKSGNKDEPSSGFVILLNVRVPVAFVILAAIVFNLQA